MTGMVLSGPLSLARRGQEPSLWARGRPFGVGPAHDACQHAAGRGERLR